jgi:CubicO group peptidase (beta-lactamase class C family)
MRLFFLIIATAFCSADSVRGQEKLFVDRVAARVAAHLDAIQKNQKLASLSYAMFLGPEYRLDYSVGYADLETKIAATPDHIYTLASVTKTITGAVVIDLIQQDRLALSDSVCNYLAGFPKNITVQDLLNHTSGLRRENENEHYLANSSYSNIVKLLPPQLRTRRHRYANINYAALGALVEIVTGEPFTKVASDYYFRITGEPLYFVNQNDGGAGQRLVKYYVRRYNRPHLHKLVAFPIWEPAALAQTSPKALATFLRHHMNPRFLNYLAGHAVLTKDLGARDGRRVRDFYALGFRLRYWGDELVYVYHDGFIYGVLSTFYYFPKKDAGFVALANLSMFPRNSLTLGGIYKDIEETIAEEFNRDLAEYAALHGSLEGVLYYENRKYQGEIIEARIDQYAKELLKKQRYEEAINLFEFNNYLFATSDNTYESLGQAYMAGGYLELAIETFKKALTINPQSKTTRRLLRALNSN